MRRVDDLIPDLWCPNWDTPHDPSAAAFDLPFSLSTAGLFGLIVDQLRDLLQPLAIGSTAHDIADAAIGPEHRAVVVLHRVTHLRRLGLGFCRVDRKAFAGGTLIHQK